MYLRGISVAEKKPSLPSLLRVFWEYRRPKEFARLVTRKTGKIPQTPVFHVNIRTGTPRGPVGRPSA